MYILPPAVVGTSQIELSKLFILILDELGLKTTGLQKRTEKYPCYVTRIYVLSLVFKASEQDLALCQ